MCLRWQIFLFAIKMKIIFRMKSERAATTRKKLKPRRALFSDVQPCSISSTLITFFRSFDRNWINQETQAPVQKRAAGKRRISNMLPHLLLLLLSLPLQRNYNINVTHHHGQDNWHKDTNEKRKAFVSPCETETGHSLYSPLVRRLTRWHRVTVMNKHLQHCTLLAVCLLVSSHHISSLHMRQVNRERDILLQGSMSYDSRAATVYAVFLGNGGKLNGKLMPNFTLIVLSAVKKEKARVDTDGEDERGRRKKNKEKSDRLEPREEEKDEWRRKKPPVILAHRHKWR